MFTQTLSLSEKNKKSISLLFIFVHQIYSLKCLEHTYTHTCVYIYIYSIVSIWLCLYLNCVACCTSMLATCFRLSSSSPAERSWAWRLFLVMVQNGGGSKILQLMVHWTRQHDMNHEILIGFCNDPYHGLLSSLYNWWFGLVVWIGSPYERKLLLRGIPRIPNHQPKPPINQ